MRNFRSLALVVAAGAGAFAATSLIAYSAGPPPAHTGGFGEPSCRACHFDYELNEPGVMVHLDSLPQTYEPGKTYGLRLRAHHADLKRAGFQLSARFEDGTQAGSFLLPDTALLQLRGTGGIDYLQHTAAGADQTTGDSISWRFLWVAPPTAQQRVSFHVAVNVANGDASEFGDRIFTHRFETNRPTQ